MQATKVPCLRSLLCLLFFAAVSLLQKEVEALQCTQEVGVCYQGSRLAVDFVNSTAQGCKPNVADADACCDLCYSNWPGCKQWVYLTESGMSGIYAGLQNYCCLQDTLDRQNNLLLSGCTSGYHDAQPSCSYEEKTCYQGERLTVDFNQPGYYDERAVGCKGGMVGAECDCSQLCASYWPECLSWLYIRRNPKNSEQDVLNGIYSAKAGVHNGYGGFCCLLGAYRNESVPCDFGSSGYQNPQCELTNDCDMEVFGGADSMNSPVMGNDEAVLKPAVGFCNDSSVETWPGFTNPMTARYNSWVHSHSGIDLNYQVYSFGTAESGPVGSFRICWRQGGSGQSGVILDYATVIGELTMIGPYAGQEFACTLGLSCFIRLEGYNFPIEGIANYRIAVVFAQPCGTATSSNLALFDGKFQEEFQNPDTFENDVDTQALIDAGENPVLQQKIMARMLIAKAGDTTTVFTLCWVDGPSSDMAIEEYTVDVGEFRMGGPSASDYECTLGVYCEVILYGRFFASSNALVITVGNSGDVCGAPGGADQAFFDGFTAPFTNPLEVTNYSAGATVANFSFGTPLVRDPASESTPYMYRLCWAGTPLTPPSQGYADIATDYLVDAGSFRMHGPDVDLTFGCTFTMPCHIVLTGSGLSTENGMFLSKTNCDWSSKDPLDASGPTWTNPTNSTITSGAYPLYVMDNYFGIPTASMTGPSSYVGGFHVCWGPNPQTGEAPYIEYRVQTGSFTLSGPQTDTQQGLLTQDQTTVDVHGSDFAGRMCTKGLACTILLDGMNLAATNRLLITTNGSKCGTTGIELSDLADLGPRDATAFDFNSNADFRVIQKSEAAPDYKIYDMGIADAGLSGEDYVLCWGHDPSTTLSDFSFVISDTTTKFTMVGVDYEDMACTLGLSCDFSLKGTLLQDSNRIIILKGLGTFPDQGKSCGEALAANSYADIRGMATKKVQPTDRYTNGVEPSVILYEDDDFFGTPHLLNGDGDFCPFTAAFPDNVASSLRIVDGEVMVYVDCPTDQTCNLGSPVCDAYATKVLLMPGDYTSTRLASLGIPDNSISYIRVRKIRRIYNLGIPLGGQPANDYKVCWTHGRNIQGNVVNYNDGSQYPTNVGIMVINGPEQTDYQCIMSLTCTITLAGVGLNGSNRVLFVDKSGNLDCESVNSLTESVFAGIENPAAHNDEGHDLEELTSTTYEVGSPGSGDPGDNYLLCWAFHPAAQEDYVVTIGVFSLCGPDILPTDPQFAGQYGGVSWECILGVKSQMDNRWGAAPVGDTCPTCCQITVTGACLASTNRIIIVSQTDTCGSRNLNKATIVGQTDDDFQNPNLVSFVNGNADVSRYNLGVAISTPAPGDYKICWSHNSVSGNHEDYKVEIGTFRLSGPRPQFTSCTMSEPCIITLTGYRFTNYGKVLLIKQPAVCGENVGWDNGNSKPIEPQWGGMANPVDSSIEQPAQGYNYKDEYNEHSDTFDAGIAFDGDPSSLGSYRVCWSFSPNPNMQDGGTEYMVQVGDFEMVGPEAGIEVKCVLGAQCNFGITGWQLSATNEVLIIGSGRRRDCRETDVSEAVIEYRDNPEVTFPGAPAAKLPGIANPKLVTDDLYDNTYSMGLVTVGGAYSKCTVKCDDYTSEDTCPTTGCVWFTGFCQNLPECIGGIFRLCWSAGVDPTPASFHVEIGTFMMSGPYVDYQVECYIGKACAFTIYGANLGHNNRLMLTETRSNCGDDNPAIAIIPGLSNPVQVSQISSNGNSQVFRLGLPSGGLAATYRMCWGFLPAVNKEYNIEVGNFVFGPPPELCSIEDGLIMKCSLPQAI